MEKTFLDNVWKYENNTLYKLHKQTKKWIDLSKNVPSGCGYICVGVTIGGETKSYRLHRLVYLYHNPDWDISDSRRDNSIDHQDEDKLNNKIENLAAVTHAQNKQNSSNYAGKEITGVWFRKDTRKKPWMAYWRENGKRRSKCFKTEEEALACRKEMVEKFYYRPCQN